jgi:hypothetical protein
MWGEIIKVALYVLLASDIPVRLAEWLFKLLLSNKTTLITGPLASGKTTFLRYISKDIIPEGPSGAPKSYKVKNAIFNEVTDFSGDTGWLRNFNERIKEHDYILFFFDVSEYLNDLKYREDCNARIEIIHRNISSDQKMLVVGTHIDMVSGNYRADIENMFAGKSYQSVLSRAVYIDTRNNECVKTILDELKK